MKEKTKTLNEIAEIININCETLRTLLCRSEFTKYISKRKEGNKNKKVFLFNKSFSNDLKNILEIKRRYGCIKLLDDYWKKGKDMTRYLFEENADLIEENKQLKESLDLAIKQYEALVNKYHEVLKLAKENADSNEFCLQELEKENEKLKQVLEENGIWEVK